MNGIYTCLWPSTGLTHHSLLLLSLAKLVQWVALECIWVTTAVTARGRLLSKSHIYGIVTADRQDITILALSREWVGWLTVWVSAKTRENIYKAVLLFHFSWYASIWKSLARRNLAIKSCCHMCRLYLYIIRDYNSISSSNITLLLLF